MSSVMFQCSPCARINYRQLVTLEPVKSAGRIESQLRTWGDMRVQLQHAKSSANWPRRDIRLPAHTLGRHCDLGACCSRFRLWFSLLNAPYLRHSRPQRNLREGHGLLHRLRDWCGLNPGRGNVRRSKSDGAQTAQQSGHSYDNPHIRPALRLARTNGRAI